VVPLNVHKIDYPILPEIEDSNDKATTQQKPPGSVSRYKNSHAHFGSSPYPFIDAFVEDQLATRGGAKGAIRAWTLNHGPNGEDTVPVGMSFQMIGNRWCENIGRAHRSNNVIWIVDFKKHQCFQSCYDPECRATSFRGRPIGLPCAVVEQLDEALFDEQLALMDEQELVSGQVASSTINCEGPKSKHSIDNFGIEDAMKSLTLGATETTTSGAKASTVGTAKQSPPSPLSDDALWGAIDSNPELFP
jgi:Herpesviridae UL52/UL70 DNA primase